MVGDPVAEVVMWKADTIGVEVRLWTRLENGRLVGSATLMVEEEFLEEMLSEVRGARAAAQQDVLF